MGDKEQGLGVPAAPSGCQPTASAPLCGGSSRSGSPNAGDETSTDTAAILKRAGEIAKKRHPNGCGATALADIVREAARELRSAEDVRIRAARTGAVDPYRHAGHCNLALFMEPMRSEIVRQCTKVTEADGRGWEPCVMKNHACHRCQHLAAIALEEQGAGGCPMNPKGLAHDVA